MRFAQGGGTFVNALGGIVRPAAGMDPYSSTVISGSAGADVVVNAGLVGGRIVLGDGADTYIEQGRFTEPGTAPERGTSQGVDLGLGDDTFRLESVGASAVTEGGAGRDRVVIAKAGADVNGVAVTGFEDVTFVTGGSITSFSGLRSITLASPDAFASYRIYDSRNPTLDLAMPAVPPQPGPFGSYQDLDIFRSSIHAVTGSDYQDRVEFLGAVVSGDVRLGGGDDHLVLNLSRGETNTLSGKVDGGVGTDLLEIYSYESPAQSLDLASISGFEQVQVNASYVFASTTRVSHLSGVAEIAVGQSSTLELASSNLAGTNVNGAFGGSLTLAADTVIGRYGPPLNSFYDQRTDIAQGDDLLSTTLVNNGRVQGDVQFYIGDDTYDGRAGSAGGTIYGNAGNDTLLGGAQAERIDGGYGADLIDGGGGTDTLLGGFGNDVLRGGSGADLLTGGAGADIFRGRAADLAGDRILDLTVGDRINVVDAALGSFAYARAGSMLTLGGTSLDIGASTTRFALAAGSAGGTDLVAVNRYTDLADFDGNGHSDLLFRNVDGTFSTWQVGGNTAANQFQINSTIIGGVSTAWKIAETFDFNGDGRSDLLFRNAGTGEFTVWTGKPGGWTVNSAVVGGVSGDWKIAGVGDLNADGKDDIVWRNDGGAFSTWHSTGAGFNVNVTLDGSVGTDWKIVGLADFDGDGKDDLLWRNVNSGTFTEWRSTGSGFTPNTYVDGTVGTGWHVDALADFNGDGRDDILWRHDGDGTFTLWNSTGDAFAPNSYSNGSVDPVWQIAQAADFNDDGAADLLWRNTQDGTFSIWQSNGNGFDANTALVGGVSTQWTFQAHDYLFG